MAAMHRRQFLSGLAAAPVVIAARPASARVQAESGFRPGPGPYGSLEGREPDANGIVLPEGFESRVVAVANEEVAGTGLVLRNLLDGGETLADGDGWIHVRNHEGNNGTGGVTAIRFDAEGEVVSATSILDGTTRNCAGGVTPWGTWLSCEEYAAGRVWECDPTGERPAEVRPLVGSFSHEAACVDPERGHVYLTEDVPDGRFYRFTPAGDPTDLSAGVLEAAVVAGDGAVTWAEVPDPTGDPTPTRLQAGASMPFNGGEGIWYDTGADRFLFTTKGDNRVWVYDPAAEQLAVLYDAAELGSEAPLTGVDNLTVAGSGDVYVAEDGGNMELVILSPEGEVAPFLRMTAPVDQTEVTGPSFSPDGTRLIVASYGREGGDDPLGGRLFEITGPFRDPAGSSGAGSTAGADTGGSTIPLDAGTSDGSSEPSEQSVLPIVAGAGVAAMALGGFVVALRRRGSS
jgi:secreted PhoX family phosphatase